MNGDKNNEIEFALINIDFELDGTVMFWLSHYLHHTIMST